jgi:pimeloyl-ACP methyl ester carboxylesterase
MPSAQAHGIRIEYETFGSAAGRPLLLIMGLGGQMIHWDDGLCRDLADSGNYVIRYDNRDVGLSSKCEDAGVPDLMKTFEKLMRKEAVSPPYTLDDMAEDGVGLLNALGIQRAHICGMSMGGMIAQTIAIRHPSRVLSLICIYSTTGNPRLPQPKPEVIGLLATPPPREREASIGHMMRLFQILHGPGYPIDETWTYNILAESYDRCYYPQGIARQLLAILTQANREPALASVDVPALVIHGTRDPLVSGEGGEATAKSIPGARLMVIEGMGHDLPHGGAWPRIIDAITAHVRDSSQ